MDLLNLDSKCFIDNLFMVVIDSTERAVKGK